MNEENKSKGKKVIVFKADNNDASDQISSEDEDDEETMLLMRKFKNIRRKWRNFIGKKPMRFAKDNKFSKLKDQNKDKDIIICY